MKKLFTVLLALPLILSAIPCIWAQGEVFSGNFGDNIKWSFTQSTGALVITGTGNMPSDTLPWDYVKTDIKSISISNGITSIAESAFSFSPIKSVSIPDSVTSIGDSAFSICTSLNSVKLPDNLKVIGSSSFYSCSSLTSIVIPKTVVEIGARAFAECSALKSVTVYPGITKIGEGILYNTQYSRNASNWESGCLYLRDYLIAANRNYSGLFSIRNGTTLIAMYAFFNFYEISYISIPDSVKHIGLCAFGGTSMTIPNSFDGAIEPGWEERSSHGSLQWKDEMLYIDKKLVTHRGVPAKLNIKPDTVLIADGALSSSPELVALIIPASVKSIGYSAFSGCNKLSSVTIKDGVAEIAGGAFFSCPSLKSITIPKSVTSIGEHAFGYTSGMNGHVKFPGFIVYGVAGSAAERYAKQNGFLFLAPGQTHTHSYKSQITKAPDCTGTGIELLTCACGVTQTKTLPVRSHNPGKWTVKTQADFAHTGVRIRCCTQCNKELNSAVIPMYTVSKINVDCNKSIASADREAGILTGFTDNTTVAAAYSVFLEPDRTELFDLLGQPANKDATVTTGFIVKLRDESGKITDSLTIAVCGDSDADGLVSSADARIALRQAVQLENLSGARLAACDVNGGGVTAEDARMILRYAVKLEVTF